jgi:hypothetical protein
MIRKIIIALALTGAVVPALALADTTTSASTTVVTDLQTTLHFGDKGDLVKILQALLVSDQTVFPEGIINGTFGPLTQKAVKRFQKKHGLPQVGQVGPRTLEKLNEKLSDSPLGLEASSSSEMDNHMGSSTNGHHEGPHLCLPPGLTIALGFLKEDGESKFPPCKGMPGHMGTSTNGTTTPWRGHGGDVDHRNHSSSTEDLLMGSTANHDIDHLLGSTTNIGQGGDDHTMLCPNPWSASSASNMMRWPSSIPCPTSSTTPAFLGQLRDTLRFGGHEGRPPFPLMSSTTMQGDLHFDSH